MVSGMRSLNVALTAAMVIGEALRQTDDPLDPGAEWVMPAAGVADGPELGNGQPAEMYRTAPKFLQRG